MACIYPGVFCAVWESMVEPLTWVLRIVTLDGWPPCGLPAYKSDFELVALVED